MFKIALIIFIVLSALISVAHMQNIACKQGFYPVLKQCNSVWANVQIPATTGNTTLCASGDLITSACMAYCGRQFSSFNPAALVQFLMKEQALNVNGEINWDKLGGKFQTKVLKQMNDIQKAVCDNLVVFLNVQNGYDGGSHWVLATAIDVNGYFQINDPLTPNSSIRKGYVIKALAIKYVQ